MRINIPIVQTLSITDVGSFELQTEKEYQLTDGGKRKPLNQRGDGVSFRGCCSTMDVTSSGVNRQQKAKWEIEDEEDTRQMMAAVSDLVRGGCSSKEEASGKRRLV